MGTAGLGIKGAAGREPRAHPLLRGKGRTLGEPGFDLALKRGVIMPPGTDGS